MVLMNLKPALAAAAALSLAACGSTADTSSTDAEDNGPDVVVAFYPLEWASTQVMGDIGSVSTLTAPGVEPHDLELTPKQVASLADADLVIYLSDFQSAVDDAIEQSGATNVLDVAQYVDLLTPVEDHDHEADEHEEEATEDEHDHGDFDPHFWQDPTRMQKVVAAISDALAEVDAGNAGTFSANADAATAELSRIDDEFTTGLQNCAINEFITTHEAFGYLADRYDLTQIGISGISPDEEPSPARIAAIQEEATEHNITTIFFETLSSDAVASSIASDLGLKTAVLDPLEGVTEKSPGTDYPSIMRANLEALRTANGCS